MIEFRYATPNDINQVLELHSRYQIDSISDADKKDGFITTAFNEEQLAELIEREQGLFVAFKGDSIVAYAMAASWAYWSRWPMFAHMIKDLPNLEYKGHFLSAENSYQYGPVCVDKTMRGQGVFEGIFNFARQEMKKRYPVLVTFINKINTRSFAAHTQKVGLDIIQEFEYNNNQYYELACLTNEKNWPEKNLQATAFIDSDNRAVIDFAKAVVGDEQDQKKQAIKLYYAVRDRIFYDPYRIQFSLEGLKASTTLSQGYGYCVAKAVLLAAVGRAVGIPTRLGFADVRNHLSSEKLKQIMQSDVFAWHGYTELYIEGCWVKATPAFNASLCDKADIKPLEFDGVTDSVFHEFDNAGNKHMEYLSEHGHFDDLPFQQIGLAYQKHYPLFVKSFDANFSLNIDGEFDQEVTTKG